MYNRNGSSSVEQTALAWVTAADHDADVRCTCACRSRVHMRLRKCIAQVGRSHGNRGEKEFSRALARVRIRKAHSLGRSTARNTASGCSTCIGMQQFSRASQPYAAADPQAPHAPTVPRELLVAHRRPVTALGALGGPRQLALQRRDD